MIVENLKQHLAEEINEESFWVGWLRENIYAEALSELQKEGKIKSFLKTGRFSWADVMEGKDFYVIIIRDRYITVPISITGPLFVERHQETHPEVPVIAVDLSVPSPCLKEQLKNKTLKIIEEYYSQKFLFKPVA